jgi:DNA-binding NarL/FixJ family response regulator
MKKHFSQLKTTNYKEEKQVIFTPREIEIINLICQQLTTKEIATQLNISDRTVDSHRNLILQKIDAKNMVGIVLYAIKHELFKL